MIPNEPQNITVEVQPGSGETGVRLFLSMIWLTELTNLPKETKDKFDRSILDICHSVGEIEEKIKLINKRVIEHSEKVKIEKNEQITTIFVDDTFKTELNTFLRDIFVQGKNIFVDQLPKLGRICGYNIGFIFANEDKFAKGSIVFISENGQWAKDFVAVGETVRNSWYGGFSKPRDLFIHQNLRIKNIQYFYKNDKIEFIIPDICNRPFEEYLDIISKNIVTSVETIEILLIRRILPKRLDVELLAPGSIKRCEHQRYGLMLYNKDIPADK